MILFPVLSINDVINTTIKCHRYCYEQMLKLGTKSSKKLIFIIAMHQSSFDLDQPFRSTIESNCYSV